MTQLDRIKDAPNWLSRAINVIEAHVHAVHNGHLLHTLSTRVRRSVSDDFILDVQVLTNAAFCETDRLVRIMMDEFDNTGAESKEIAMRVGDLLVLFVTALIGEEFVAPSDVEKARIEHEKQLANAVENESPSEQE